MIDDNDPRILAGKAERFLRNNHPYDYKHMSRKEVDEYCQAKAEAAKEMAEALINSGVAPESAWNQAIRSEILESETD
ncbi:MAG TPA: hypothetical protein VLH15_09885 [Dehalococcoidales bacterium]|nr:hypothetical protein [Dehalococcoidales bacterium]